MKVTIKDVAKKAGVSTSTVSRALSDHPGISKERKLKIQQIVKELKYKPNVMARGLCNKKTNIVGVILPNIIKNLYFIDIMKGISKCATSQNYYITYVFCNDDREELEYIEGVCDTKLVDGVIIIKNDDYEEKVVYLKEKDIKFTTIEAIEDDQLIKYNKSYQIGYNSLVELIKEMNDKRN